MHQAQAIFGQGAQDYGNAFVDKMETNIEEYDYVKFMTRKNIDNGAKKTPQDDEDGAQPKKKKRSKRPNIVRYSFEHLYKLKEIPKPKNMTVIEKQVHDWNTHFDSRKISQRDQLKEVRLRRRKRLLEHNPVLYDHMKEFTP